MPRGSPFTALCGQLARLRNPERADLHIHTTASDGDFTPSQVVSMARQAGLCAAAITDHDTLAGIEEARHAAREPFELITGVEISAEYAGREVHLLGYCVRLDYLPLNACLQMVRASRRERFRDFVVRLAERGQRIPEDRVRIVEGRSESLGRRHLANLLVACGSARTRSEAFHRYLNPLSQQVLPKRLVKIDEAIRHVIDAGGMASLAHPPELSEADFRTLAAMGLGAIEVDYPGLTRTEISRMRDLANRLGLATTGGSDCHGADPAHRRIGSHGVSIDELTRLKIDCTSGTRVPLHSG